MRNVSLKVVHVSIPIPFGPLPPLVFLGDISLPSIFLILVALVISAGALTVFVPGPHAQPAKLKLALRTPHMHAPLQIKVIH